METQNTTETITVKTPDIICGGCAGSIKNALGKMEGVKKVEVDVNTKMVSIEYGKQISREQITAQEAKANIPPFIGVYKVYCRAVYLFLSIFQNFYKRTGTKFIWRKSG
jgi:copper chaperone CopZ